MLKLSEYMKEEVSSQQAALRICSFATGDNHRILHATNELHGVQTTTPNILEARTINSNTLHQKSRHTINMALVLSYVSISKLISF